MKTTLPPLVPSTFNTKTESILQCSIPLELSSLCLKEIIYPDTPSCESFLDFYKHIQESTFSHQKSSLVIENPLVDCKIKESKKVDSPKVNLPSLKSQKVDSTQITVVKFSCKTGCDNHSQVCSPSFLKNPFYILLHGFLVFKLQTMDKMKSVKVEEVISSMNSTVDDLLTVDLPGKYLVCFFTLTLYRITINLLFLGFSLDIINLLESYLLDCWKSVMQLNLPPLVFDLLKIIQSVADLQPSLTCLCLVKVKEEMTKIVKDFPQLNCKKQGI